MSDDYEQFTNAELAGELYVAIVNPELSDRDSGDLIRPASQMASALWARLRGPYCHVEGCRNEHMRSFPWCPWHRPESHGPLPDDFPPNPNPMP